MPMTTGTIERGIQIIHMDSWREFVDFIETTHSNHPAYVYRGQANAQWTLESTLDRLESRFSKHPNYSGDIPNEFNCPPASRDEHLRAFRQVVCGKRGNNPTRLTEDEWWILGQHHGLATPMLDWTLSPFAALFFAFEQEHVREDSALIKPDHRAVYALSSSCVNEDTGNKELRPIIPDTETSHRTRNQLGVLVKMPPHCDLEEYIAEQFECDNQKDSSAARAILQKIVIPNKSRKDCLKLLNKMNINRASLFPDIDGAAQYINAMWELDFDTSFGFLKGQ